MAPSNLWCEQWCVATMSTRTFVTKSGHDKNRVSWGAGAEPKFDESRTLPAVNERYQVQLQIAHEGSVEATMENYNMSVSSSIRGQPQQISAGDWKDEKLEYIATVSRQEPRARAHRKYIMGHAHTCPINVPLKWQISKLWAFKFPLLVNALVTPISLK